jgi:thiamine transport system permease protein
MIYKLLRYVCLGSVLAFLIFTLIIPLIVLFSSATDLASIKENLLDPRIISAAKFTTFQTLLSTLFSGMIGLPLGLAIAFHPRAHQLRKILSLSFGVPSLIAAFSWVLILGRTGILAKWGIFLDIAYSVKAVILAHVFFNAPFIALLVSIAVAQVPSDLLDAARNLGATRFRVFKNLIWPEIRSAFSGSLAQVFCFCMMSFALILILGGGPPVQTLETSIYQSLRFGIPQMDLAIAAAIWQIALSIFPLIVFMKTRAKILPVSDFKRVRAYPYRGARFITTLCVFFLTPYILFVFQTFPHLFQLIIRPEFILSIIQPLKLSIALGLCSALLTVSLTFISILNLRSTSWLRPAVEFLIQVPSGISILVIGLGFWISYSQWIDPFEGSFFSMVLLQTISFLPFSFRWLRWLDEKSHRLLFETARNLGATNRQAFLAAEWPRWRKPLLFVFAMIFGGSIGELAALSLFYSEKLMPFSVLISRLLNQYRFPEAEAVSLLVLLFSVGSMAFIVTKFDKETNL